MSEYKDLAELYASLYQYEQELEHLNNLVDELEKQIENYQKASPYTSWLEQTV
jgi:prefoldin subunit 5